MGLGLLSGRCRLYPQHRKYRCGASTDVVGHFQTHALQQSMAVIKVASGQELRNFASK